MGNDKMRVTDHVNAGLTTVQRSFPCPECGDTLKRPTAIHMSLEMVGLPTRVEICMRCRAQFTEDGTVLVHGTSSKE